MKTTQAIKITAIIKAKNEAHQICECLNSVKDFADEVIVIDDQSTDKTAALARDLGAIVITVPDRDQPLDILDRIGFLNATGDWLLRLDADERVTPSLARELRKTATDNRCVGVRFARKNMMFGGWARHGGWFKSDQLRFFRADAWDREWNLDLHSQVPVGGPIITLPAREDLATIHWDYNHISQFVNRGLINYAQAEALERHNSGSRFSSLRFVLKPIHRFLGRYIVRGGWRDGVRGLILAALLAAYDLCIEAYLWDIERQQKSK
jgi:glycosyltransferase involved in cell wall biosynthesis